MSNELLYLGVGATAIYLFTRAKKNTSVSAPATLSVPKVVDPGMKIDVDPGYNTPIPDFSDPKYKVFMTSLAADDGGSLTIPGIFNPGDLNELNPEHNLYVSNISVSEWITQIHALAAEKKITLQQSIDTIFVSAPPEDRAALKNAAQTMKLLDPEVSIKMTAGAKSNVVKSGAGIFAVVAVLAISYYLIMNKS